ncbi:MAG: isopenicillin N synthase family oxygenase [Deltaproteobacteria bacterium]|nr:MAG: isopenicillin N synthase family oxygenase [Deltaproteobacteria bacterium]
MAEQTIPVVDLARFLDGDAADQRAFVAALGEALTEWGFVAVERHGLDLAALASTFAAIKSLFDLPDEVKRRFEDPAGGRQRGYTSFGRERAKGRDVADIKEFWHVGPELAADHPMAGRIQPNLWPDDVLPALRPAATRLWASMHGVAAVLLRALARFLDAEEGALLRMVDGGNTILRMIHYPPPHEAEPVGEGAVWAAAHEDINLMTLLPEATEPGLELLRRDGTWLPVTPIPGQLIADTGDMFQRLTNGAIPATTHRVLAPPGIRSHRYSMPFFVHPVPDQVLAPLPGFVSDARPRRWADITAEAYLGERLRDNGVAHDGRAKA